MIGAIAVVLAVAAEAIVIYVIGAWWGVSYSSDDQHAVNAVTVVAVTLVAFGLPRFLGNLDIPGGARWVIAAFVIWLVLYGALRIEFGGDFWIWEFGWVTHFIQDPSGTTRNHTDALVGGILLIAALGWGLFRSETDVDLELLPKQLGGGFAAVTLMSVLASSASAAGDVARGAGGFYAVAVVSLAFSQSARSGATIGAVRTGGITAMLMGGTLVATALCLLVFGLLWGPLAPPAGRLIGAVLEVVLLVIFTPPAWLMAQFLELIFGGPGGGPDIFSNVRDISADARDPSRAEDRSGFERFVVYAARAFFLLVAVGFIAGVVKVFTHFRRRAQPPGAMPGATGSAGSLGDDLRSLFGNLSFRRSAPPPPAGDNAVRLYLSVLDEASRRGHERPPAATPGEFRPELADTFHAPATDDITAAFEQARYAGRPVDPNRVRELERRWRSSLK
ncbi:MAG TPA: DUF4129 domain-containing protein [Tepidiformaceae bacterium]|nr:DUF4129 domain-containing protein [Tepidiformaceae bacterium]